MLLLILACTASKPADTSGGADSGIDSGVHDTAAIDPWGEDAAVPEGPDVPVSGYAINFGPPWGGVVGAEISVVELPHYTAITDADGRFDLGPLPRGLRVSFELSHPDQAPIRTGTFLLGDPMDGGDAITNLSFQSPTPALYALMAQATGITPQDDRCQVATTVTRRGHDMVTGSGTHGEPGATASLSPDAAWDAGPVYFNLSASNVIWPDSSLGQTTDDGGVLWANVPPGHYLMEGAKDGASIRPVKIDCTAGYLVNASPPWGLQVLTGGLDPEDPGYQG